MFTALYFNAANLLINRLTRTAIVTDGNLVIDRAVLAQSVRATTRFHGASCTVTLDPTTGNRVNDPAALSRCARDGAPITARTSETLRGTGSRSRRRR